MRRDLLCAAVAAFLLIHASALAQQQNQDQQGQTSGQTSQQASSQTAAQSSSQSAAPAQTAPVDPLVAAARKAREQKKDQPKPARVFDNDNIPTQGGVSAVGSAPGGESTAGGAAAEPDGDQAAGKTAAPPSGNDEKTWRERFARLRKKLEQDQADLEIMQRELGVLDVQYYNDPMKGMQQGYTRSDINEKTAKIDEKKKQIEADQQALSDAEDELRRSGGDIGWAR
jgi:DNA repair exonuclease SbcCD ATPase subunit